MKKRISKILIANRGEIACRIVRSAQKLGIKTVSVYSNIDQNSRNVLMSDEAYCIGKASSRDSYLNMDKIIDVAKRTKCDAIHPGYGFLSENASFAEYCCNNGIIFIGPPASAIRDMGVKSISKKIMSNADVPVIPGYHENDQSDSVLESKAISIGFPLMIKAVYGGGGKGMRIVFKKEDFLTQLESARRESLSSFGDQSVLLEKFVIAPRHIEVQIFADQFGNCVYLNERDCSVQRRHQKIIEEAPAPGIDISLREKIGLAAVKAAKAVNYVGAGTVEFIYEEKTKSFYFMEMNTRLQVEHPVTEMITNTDLVEWQIKVASGEKLPLKQTEIPLIGHSVEARIYAEDPYNGFLPCAGSLTYLNIPKEQADFRVETGVRQGDEVSVHYDPMIAKLVVWGEDRTKAFSKLRTKLLDSHIVGVNTNIEFLATLCSNEKLLNGEVNTAFIDENKDELLKRMVPNSQTIAEAAFGLLLWEEKRDTAILSRTHDPYNAFVTERGFRVNHLYCRDLKFIDGNGQEIPLKITYNKSKCYSIQVGQDKSYDIDGYLLENEDNEIVLVSNFKNQVSKSKIFIQDDGFIHIFTLNGSFSFEIWSPKFDKMDSQSELLMSAVAPMPGIVNNVFVKSGDKVIAGDTVMVIIAMKMEHLIKSPKDGVIKEVLFSVGQSVPRNVPVITFEEN